MADSEPIRGARVSIVWNDDSVPLTTLGLDVGVAHDQDGDPVTTDSTLSAAPVFLELND